MRRTVTRAGGYYYPVQLVPAAQPGSAQRRQPGWRQHRLSNGRPRGARGSLDRKSFRCEEVPWYFRFSGETRPLRYCPNWMIRIA